MNEKIEVNESNDSNPALNFVIELITYLLNRYMPLICVAFISLYSLGYATWEPYFIIGFMMFSNTFSFKCGYAHSELDKTNWDE